MSERRDDELLAKPRAINWKVVHRGSNAFGKHSARDCRAGTRTSIVLLHARVRICISARAYIRFRAPISIPNPNQTKDQTFSSRRRGTQSFFSSPPMRLKRNPPISFALFGFNLWGERTRSCRNIDAWSGDDDDDDDDSEDPA